MNPQEFENYLLTTRQELTEAFKFGEVTENEVLTKVVLDYQQKIAISLFNKIDHMSGLIIESKNSIIKDNRERFELIMKKIEPSEK